VCACRCAAKACRRLSRDHSAEIAGQEDMLSEYDKKDDAWLALRRQLKGRRTGTSSGTVPCMK
jgi:hypothetical protein